MTASAVILPPPPLEMAEQALMLHPGAFVPAPELTSAVMRTFVDPAGTLSNDDHAHLEDAYIGFLWTNAPGAYQGREVLGTAEIFSPKGQAWVKARQEAQVLAWFGVVPDFIITLSAPFVAERLARQDYASVCALIEHELYHCAQALNDFGAPRFRRDGRPVYCIKGHDVEEHFGVVERYGAYSADLQRLVEAANRGPSVAAADVAGVCGSCLRRVV